YALESWESVTSSSQMFVKILEGSDVENVEIQLAALRDKFRGGSGGEAEKDDITHNLQPLSDIHFNSDYDAFSQRQAHKPTLMGLFAVALFLLLLGCINFINLTTAQASQRAKEIGVRKTMGSGQTNIVIQFLIETLII